LDELSTANLSARSELSFAPDLDHYGVLPVVLKALRKRLRKMTDIELLRFGKDNRYMCNPYANMGKLRLRGHRRRD
jgi:hypothetical protein